jgi:hypothetical protein
VVATILLLALTVTLFASIFAFVTSFPAPPAQNSNQFQATLIYNSGATDIVGLNIVHLAGPQVSTNAQIYLKSAGHPCMSGCPFVGSVPVSLGITTPYWNLGQTWTALFTSFPGSSSYPGDPVPDNITVSIVTDANLIFSIILPGQSISVPATITATWISPAAPSAGQAYEVFATIAGNLGTNIPHLTGVPGEATGPQPMSYNAATAYWYYNIAAESTSTAGTFVGFVSATSANGASATAPVTVVITSSSSSNGPLSVAVVLSDTYPTPGAVETVQAIVTETVTLARSPLTVAFTASTDVKASTTLWTSTGPPGQTITGPSTVSVLSQTSWTVPTTPSGPQYYFVNATATVTGLSPATGSLVFSTVPVVSATPSQGPTGSSVLVSGTGATPSGAISVTFGTTVVSCTLGGSLTASSSGSFSCAFSVPSGYAGTTPTITVTDSTSGLSGTTQYSVTTPTISLTPTQGPSGISVLVSGTGFTPTTTTGGAITITTTFSGTSIGSCGATVGSTGPSIGAFTCTVVISGTASGTAYTVTATGSDGTFDRATASYKITTPAITLSPAQGPSGVSVTVTGSGFTQGATITTTIGSGATITSCGATVATGGTFTCSVTITSGTAAAYTVTATGSDGGADVATKSFTVTTPGLSLNPTSGSTTGTSVTATGSGFTPGATITFTISTGGTISGAGTCTVSATGGFSCTFTVSGSATHSPYTITATGSDGSFDKATATYST